MKTRHEEMRDQVKAFHKEHPEVWGLFERYTLERIGRGFKHYSARGVFHRIRWETAIPEYNQGEEFKLNDHYSPFYARAFMTKHPEHAGFFRTRRQKSKDGAATGLDPLGPDYFDNE